MHAAHGMLLRWPVRKPHRGWTAAQRDRFRRDGYVVLKGVFAPDECRRFLRQVGGLRGGTRRLGGPAPWEDRGARMLNRHLCDPVALRFLIDERLHRPLADCLGDEPEAIGSTLVVEGSERLLYQDQYDLPDCMSAWIAMVDIDEDNGPLLVQPGSHGGRLVTGRNAGGELRPGGIRAEMPHIRYFPLVREAFRENGRDVVRVTVNRGDVVLFHGRLIHGGAPMRRPDTPRYALACHYIPYHSETWDRAWPRISFDGARRVLYRNGDAGSGARRSAAAWSE